MPLIPSITLARIVCLGASMAASCTAQSEAPDASRTACSYPTLVGASLGTSTVLCCDETLAPAAERRPMPLQLDFEGVALECTHDSAGWWSLRSDGAWFNVALKSNPHPSALALVPGVGAGHALAFRLPPSAVGLDPMEKVMLELFGRFGGGAATMIPFGEERYIAFRILLPSSFQPPTEPGAMLIVWQLWQGAPYGPPLRMEIDAKIRPVFLALNDRTGSHPCASDPGCTPPAPHEGVVELHRGAPLARDRWHDVVVGVLPRYVGLGEGKVRIWIDERGAERPSYEADVSIGYDPTGYGSYPEAALRGLDHPNESLEVAVGIYRTPQETDQTVVFDQVRVGRSLEEIGASSDGGW